MTSSPLSNSTPRTPRLRASPRLRDRPAQRRTPTQNETPQTPAQSAGASSNASLVTQPPQVLTELTDNNHRSTMGGQSQTTVGSVKRCLKGGGKWSPKKKSQSPKKTSVPGGEENSPFVCVPIPKNLGGPPRLVQQGINGPAFVQKRDCAICRIQEANLGRSQDNKHPVPHRAHHRRCPKNQKTRGTTENNVRLAKIVENYVKTNSEPVSFGAVPSDASDFFDPKRSNCSSQASRASTLSSFQSSVAKLTDPPLPKFDDPLDNLDSLGSHLSQVLHDRLDRFQRRKEFKMANESNAPLSVALLFHYLTDLVKLSRSKSRGTLPTFNNFQKLELRGTFFQHRNIFFTFPPDNSPVPYANYHALTGKKVFILDWHFAFPNVDLTCPACGSGQLSAHRTQFSHNWKLFPLINADGTTSWGSVMRYNCLACDKKTPANDPKLLLSLPPHMRQCYPVEPRYANGAFHLTQQASDELDAVMLTYGNGDFFARKLYQTASRNYLRAVENYLSIVPHSHKGGHAYHLDLHEWLGRLPPTGESIRECYLMAENSENTVYGYSHLDRYKRELQSVGRNLNFVACCIDWTFAMVRTYSGSRAKACFTMKIGTGETAGVFLVPSTSVRDVAHALQQLVLKRRFSPIILYTDTWPSGKEFWHGVFGNATHGRLGLFHAMHRISNTFEKVDQELHWKAVVSLRNCFYSYVKQDWCNLKEALKEGLFSDGREKLGELQIDQLQHSRKWKECYDKYLRKDIHPPAMIVEKLDDFLLSYHFEIDSQGRRILTKRSTDVIEEQKDKVQYVSDIPIEGYKYYDEVKAGPGSKTGLSTWMSRRLESILEKSHGRMAHYGNIGMREQLADALIMRGISEDNCKTRHQRSIKLHGKLRKKKARDNAFPDFFRECPPFVDNSLLWHLNQMSRAKGHSIIFADVEALPADNGESFLSRYFHQQISRNRIHNQFRLSDQCNCAECGMVEFPLVVGRGQFAKKPLAESINLRSPMTNDQEPMSALTETTFPEENSPNPTKLVGGRQVNLSQVTEPSAVDVRNERSAIVNPYLTRIAPRQLFQGISSQTAIPVPGFALNWCQAIPHVPNDACFPLPPHYCDKYFDYLQRRNHQKIRGRPPHGNSVRNGAIVSCHKTRIQKAARDWSAATST